MMNSRQNQEYREWLHIERSSPRRVISKNTVYNAVMKDLSFVKGMNAKTYTLYRKWLQIQNDKDASEYNNFKSDEKFWKKYKEDKEFQDKFGRFMSGTEILDPTAVELLKHFNLDVPSSGKKIKRTKGMVAFKKIYGVKDFIWKPHLLDESPLLRGWDGPEDDPDRDWIDETHGAIFPKVIHCKDKASKKEYWSILRNYTHTQENNNNQGRNLYFLVESGGLTLGIFALSSDFKDLEGRDDYIGWSREIRTKKPHVMINHTAIVSTCSSTEPLGYNYAGGKLMILLAMSDVVVNAWEERYGHKLVGLTTTSLYGANEKKGGTIYSGLDPYWNEFGESKGETSFELSKETTALARKYLSQAHPKEYWMWFRGKKDDNTAMLTYRTQRSLTFLYNQLGIPKSEYTTNHKRGIYFAHLYDNFKEFLRKEISESDLIRRTDIQNDVESLSDYWREKHAMGRIRLLMKKNRTRVNYNPFGNDVETFYSDMAGMTWDEAKARYLSNDGNT